MIHTEHEIFVPTLDYKHLYRPFNELKCGYSPMKIRPNHIDLPWQEEHPLPLQRSNEQQDVDHKTKEPCEQRENLSNYIIRASESYRLLLKSSSNRV